MPQLSQPGGQPIQQSANESPSIIVVASQQGSVAALRAADGAPIWQAQMELDVSSVVCDRERVYVATHADAHLGGEPPARIVALRAADGTPDWRQAVKGLAGRAALALDGDRLVASSNMGDGAVCAFETRTGRLRWRYALYHGWARLFDPLTPWGSFIAQVRWRWPAIALERLITLQGGIAYISENEAPYPPHFTALDVRNGAVRWRYHHYFDTLTVAKDGTRVAVQGATFEGEQRHERSLSVFNARTGAAQATLAPLGSSVILAITGSDAAHILCILEHHLAVIVARRLEDGGELWRAPIQLNTSEENDEAGEEGQTIHHTAPMVALQIVTGRDSLCYAQHMRRLPGGDPLAEVTVLDTITGRRLWRWRSPIGLDKNVNSVTLVGDGEAL